MQESQITHTVLMIRPAAFRSNPQTASSNAYQGPTGLTADDEQSRALEEFETLVTKLRQADIRVIVVDDTPEPVTPDAVFPNNWVSFHADGRVVLYPMLAENRRTERRADVLEELAFNHGFDVREIIDLSPLEKEDRFLEGTGSMVLDRVHRIAYACVSPRTTRDALGAFSERMEYDVEAFDAVDRDGQPIYHTNVMMHVGRSLAVVCLDSVQGDIAKQRLRRRFEESGHTLLDLSQEQVEQFAGNMLELRTTEGEAVTVMSQSALDALTPTQRSEIERHTTILASPIPTIEKSAGGSVRCMLAEVHLPQRSGV